VDRQQRQQSLASFHSLRLHWLIHWLFDDLDRDIGEAVPAVRTGGNAACLPRAQVSSHSFVALCSFDALAGSFSSLATKFAEIFVGLVAGQATHQVPNICLDAPYSHGQPSDSHTRHHLSVSSEHT
jgi:hypothetical protein